jgi:hypothetical protein
LEVLAHILPPVEGPEVGLRLAKELFLWIVRELHHPGRVICGKETLLVRVDQAHSLLLGRGRVRCVREELPLDLNRILLHTPPFEPTLKHFREFVDLLAHPLPVPLPLAKDLPQAVKVPLQASRFITQCPRIGQAGVDGPHPTSGRRGAPAEVAADRGSSRANINPANHAAARNDAGIRVEEGRGLG